MEMIKMTNNYALYKERLKDNNKEFYVLVSNIINSSIQINIKLNNNINKTESNNCYIIATNMEDDKIRNAILQIYEEFKQKGYRNFTGEIKIIVSNEEELKRANNIKEISSLKITLGKEQNFNEQKQKSQKQEQIMSEFKARVISQNGDNVIHTIGNTYSNGKVTKISPKEMYNEYQQLIQKPEYQYLNNLSKEELTNELIDIINRSTSRYETENLTTISNSSNLNNISKETLNQASGDDLVATKMGVVIKDPTSQGTNMATVIEQEKNGNYIAKEADIKDITSSQSNYQIADSNTVYNSTAPKFEEEQIQSEKERKEYYLDRDGTIYDNEGRSIGINGKDGYLVDEENQLHHYEENIGYIGDINDMGKSSSMDKNKPKTHSKVKPQENKSSGIISLPVIVLILSGLLLISSAVLYLMSK